MSSLGLLDAEPKKITSDWDRALPSSALSRRPGSKDTGLRCDGLAIAETERRGAGRSRCVMRGRRTRQRIRRAFFAVLLQQLRIIWPMLSGILLLMLGPGLMIGHIEGWKVSDALYFTFVTGLTIGYGDLTPRHIASRCLAVVIGFCGIVLAGLVAAVSVRALNAATEYSDR